MRLFAAIVPPAEAIEQIAEVQKKAHTWIQAKGAYTKPDKFHITLQFFGEAFPQSVTEVQISEAIRGVGPFDLRLSILAGFPDSRLKRVMHLEPDTCAEFLQIMKYWGTPTEPNDRPHLTLARFNQPVELPRVKFEPIQFSVSSVRLLNSLHVGTESNYTLQNEFQLG